MKMRAMVALGFVEDTLYDLMQEYQNMREEGEDDMRTVIDRLQIAIHTILDNEDCENA
jgi:hypothetical protein